MATHPTLNMSHSSYYNSLNHLATKITTNTRTTFLITIITIITIIPNIHILLLHSLPIFLHEVANVAFKYTMVCVSECVCLCVSECV